MLLRYGLAFALPVAATALLLAVTLPLREELQGVAAASLEAMRAALKAGDGDLPGAAGDKVRHLSALLGWLSASALVVSGALAAGLAPRRASQKQRANLLTWMLAGFLAARGLFGTPGLGLAGFATSLGLGLACAIAIMLMRGRTAGESVPAR